MDNFFIGAASAATVFVLAKYVARLEVQMRERALARAKARTITETLLRTMGGQFYQGSASGTVVASFILPTPPIDYEHGRRLARTICDGAREYAQANLAAWTEETAESAPAEAEKH